MTVLHDCRDVDPADLLQALYVAARKPTSRNAHFSYSMAQAELNASNGRVGHVLGRPINVDFNSMAQVSSSLYDEAHGNGAFDCVLCDLKARSVPTPERTGTRDVRGVGESLSSRSNADADFVGSPFNALRRRRASSDRLLASPAVGGMREAAHRPSTLRDTSSGMLGCEDSAPASDATSPPTGDVLAALQPSVEGSAPAALAASRQVRQLVAEREETAEASTRAVGGGGSTSARTNGGQYDSERSTRGAEARSGRANTEGAAPNIRRDTSRGAGNAFRAVIGARQERADEFTSYNDVDLAAQQMGRLGVSTNSIGDPRLTQHDWQYSPNTRGQSSSFTGGQPSSHSGGPSSSYTGGPSSSYAGGQFSSYSGRQSSSYNGGQSSSHNGGQFSSYTGGQPSSYHEDLYESSSLRLGHNQAVESATNPSTGRRSWQDTWEPWDPSVFLRGALTAQDDSVRTQPPLAAGQDGQGHEHFNDQDDSNTNTQVGDSLSDEHLSGDEDAMGDALHEQDRFSPSWYADEEYTEERLQREMHAGGYYQEPVLPEERYTQRMYEGETEVHNRYLHSEEMQPRRAAPRLMYERGEAGASQPELYTEQPYAQRDYGLLDSDDEDALLGIGMPQLHLGPYDGLSAFATRLHGLRLLVYMSAHLLHTDNFDVGDEAELIMPIGGAALPFGYVFREQQKAAGVPPAIRDELMPAVPFTRRQLTYDGCDECSICLCEFAEQPEGCKDTNCVRVLPCKHVYHVECIDPWLARSFACPNCKQLVCKDPAAVEQNE
mmetsp:Transcript_32550/g.78966  ORF Transcript_32550/g.78966 Transcript_32550/m.78966 type:complete len:777 (-) Transcript_32550:583-2913(-)